MSEEKHPFWQKCMEEFHDWWNAEEGRNYVVSMTHFLEHNRTLALAVALGKLNYQVGNGGFFQWIDNGYISHVEETIEALKALDTENAQKVIGMIEQFDDMYDGGGNGRSFHGPWRVEKTMETCYDEDGGEEYEEEVEYDLSEEASPLSNTLSSQYYKLNDQLMDEIESWLERQLQPAGESV